MKKNARRMYNTHIIKAEKETVMSQLLDVLDALDKNPNSNEEYTLDLSCFTAEEKHEFELRAIEIVALRAKMRGHTYEMASTPLPKHY